MPKYELFVSKAIDPATTDYRMGSLPEHTIHLDNAQTDQQAQDQSQEIMALYATSTTKQYSFRLIKRHDATTVPLK